MDDEFNHLSVEMADSVKTYEERSRVIDEISKILGVDTVMVRYPEEPLGTFGGKFLDANLDGTVSPWDVCREIGKIKGVIEAAIKPTFQIPWRPDLGGPSSPSP